MKKIILSLLSSVVIFTMAFSQSFELYHDNQVFPSGGSFTVADVPSASLMLGHMSIKNVSSTAKLVMAKKEEIQVVPGSMNTFCWVVCWANTIFVSPMGITLEPGVTNNEFSGDYMPLNNAGVTIMRYTFFDDANPSDSAHFYIHFNAGTVGVNDLAGNGKNTFSAAYPNPARSQVSIDYALNPESRNAKISIHNLLGSVVKEARLNDLSGKLTLDVSDLNEGFYFYSIIINNEVLETKRLVISR